MKIVFLGAGNLATNLAMALKNHGHEIVQVYSRTEESAERLARQTVAEAITRLNRLVHDADLYILSVKDDAIRQVLDHFPVSDGFLVHTAGSVPMDVLKGHAARYGVIYPLQTFSRERLVDFNNIPVCLEAANDSALAYLEETMSKLSQNIYHIDSRQRAYLHVAAVFACNFSNFMMAMAQEILQKHNMPFEMMMPLIKETVDKAMENTPVPSQTGPAIRGDQQTMERHLKLLDGSDKLQNLYRFVSTTIFNYYNSDQQGE
jgi:predicted short-subunit dehydrogenase-like oxidoreductase (DUF2520 family)